MAYVKINGVQVDEHDIWDLGYAMAACNLPKSSNPFHQDSYEGMAWGDGWADFDMNDRKNHFK